MASFDEAIPPGGRGEVVVHVDTSQLEGAQSRWVILETNDPRRAMVKLQINLEVRGSVRLLPERALRLGRGRRSEPEGRLLIQRDPTEEGVLRPHELQASEPWLHVALRPAREAEAVGSAVAAAGDWVLEARIAETAPLGASRATIRFRTGLQREPEIAIPVFVYVRPPVRVSPEVVRLAPATPGGPFEGELLVVVAAGEEAPAPEFEAHPEGFRVEAERTGPRHYRLRVRWAGEGAPPEGLLRIRVGGHDLEVPLRGDGAASSDSRQES